MTASTRRNRQSMQSQLSSPTFSTGSSSSLGTNSLLQTSGLSTTQQPNSANSLMQQQQQLAVMMALQQLQQSQQQKNNSTQNAQLQSVNATSPAAQRRMRQDPVYGEPDDKPSRPEIKRMAEQSEEEVSARQLMMAKDIKMDADSAQANGDRPQARKLRAKVEQRLSDIQDKYPNTPAAKEAEQLRAGLYR